MGEVVIIGAGGHAKEVHEWLLGGQSIYQPIGCLVSEPGSHRKVDFLPILGRITDRPEDRYVLGIGAWEPRESVLKARGSKGAVTLVHNQAHVPNRQVWTSIGCVVGPRAEIGRYNTIEGKGAIFHRGCIVTHDCEIGPFSFIGPGAVLCGGARVEAYAFVGANATMGPRSVLEEGAILGSGASLPQGKTVPAGQSYAGNPAEPCVSRVGNPFHQAPSAPSARG